MTALIAAEGITVTRRRREILQQVSLTVGEKDFVTLIGPNGAGKTTLLRCLMGFFRPTRGRVWRRPGLRIGYVPQSLNFNRDVPIDVGGFLALNADSRRVPALAEKGECAHLLKTPLSALSGGEWQRVLLTRALSESPDLLILDEPAQQLDLSGQLSLYRLIGDWHQRHSLGILMVSHDLHWVMSQTRQVVCLFGHVCCHGKPQAVAQDPEFISRFGDDMARLMAVYQHHHDHTHADHRHG